MADENLARAIKARRTASESGPGQAIARHNEIRRISHQRNQPLTAINNDAQAGDFSATGAGLDKQANLS